MLSFEAERESELSEVVQEGRSLSIEGVPELFEVVGSGRVQRSRGIR